MTELTESTPTLLFSDPCGGDVVVVRLCPKCGRFLRKGKVTLETDGLGFDTVHLTGWTCAKCGEVEPDWDRL